MSSSPPFEFTDAHAHRLATAIGLLGASGPRTAAFLIEPGRDEFELCVRHDDDALAHLPALCALHPGPIVLVSSRDAGSVVADDDIGLFDAAVDVAADLGAVLVDWLVVDDGTVTSLGWDGLPGWVVRSTGRDRSRGG